MKKSKYIYAVYILVLCALTLFFMLLPAVAQKFESKKSTRGIISTEKLVQSTQDYSPAQIFEFIFQKSDIQNISRVENLKSTSETSGDCNKIFSTVFAKNDEFSNYASKQITGTNLKNSASFKFITVYDDEVVWFNFNVCNFKNLTICYENQTLTPIFIVFRHGAKETTLDKFLLDEKKLYFLEQSMKSYYESLGIKSEKSHFDRTEEDNGNKSNVISDFVDISLFLGLEDVVNFYKTVIYEYDFKYSALPNDDAEN